MPFVAYPTLADAAREYQITIERASFIHALPFAPSDSFRTELAFTLNETTFENSEFAVCETLIYPVLREVWKSYYREFMLWSHPSLTANGDLSGVPDYLLAKRSPLGREVMDRPYVLIVEAKKDDPARGWGQCLVAMIAAQQLNGSAENDLFGIATNGKYWEFGKLRGSQCTRELRSYTLFDLDELFAAINFVFDQCRRQLSDFAQAN